MTCLRMQNLLGTIPAETTEPEEANVMQCHPSLLLRGTDC